MAKKRNQEVSITDLAKRGLERIVKLSQSQSISEKLQSFNILLFVFILTISITYYLAGASTTELSFLFVLGFSFVIALIASLGYGPILSVVSNISTNKIESLRVGITVLFVALTSGVAALTFDVKLLANLSLVLTGLQLIIIPISGFLFPKFSVEDRKIDLSQLWVALGRISCIVGIISFIMDIALLLL